MSRRVQVTFLIQLSAGIVLLSNLTACGPPLNATDGLLREGTLTTLDGASKASMEGMPERSLGTAVSFDRSEWSPKLIELDQSQVQHHPSYGSSRPPCDMIDFSEAWPTLETAFGTGEDRTGQMMNGLVAPPAAALELLVLPFRMLITPPWSIITSPRDVQIMQTPGDAVRRVRTAWLQHGTNNRKDEK
ncbi:MAG: hypothetical protein CMJ33_01875 [Phycisphaerae bacterium]|nr:hypothetical protein [Phycisphaerae bacterium]HAW95421.1 hypothetical protein [Phycisphaerales bacterium]